MTAPPRTSVVIPVLNEQARIGALLDALAEGGVERIVVDGGSSDDTVALAGKHGAEQVLHSPPGRGRQLDLGWRAARAPVVVFLHADTRLERGWQDALHAALRDPRVSGGAFRLRFDSPRAAFRVVEAGARLRARLAGLPYGDQALFARREVLERVGGVPDVPIFEDLDLARALARAGRLALLPQLAHTSPRRYAPGVARTVLRNALALGAWALGLDRARVARWYRGGPRA